VLLLELCAQQMEKVVLFRTPRFVRDHKLGVCIARCDERLDKHAVALFTVHHIGSQDQAGTTVPPNPLCCHLPPPAEVLEPQPHIKVVKLGIHPREVKQRLSVVRRDDVKAELTDGSDSRKY
jgi:hypothetical protein